MNIYRQGLSIGFRAQPRVGRHVGMSRSSLHCPWHDPHFAPWLKARQQAPAGGNEQDCDCPLARVPALAPFQVRSFRFQWPADLLASWAFEMEGVILGWFVLVSTGSVLALAIFGSLQFLGTLISPFFGMAGDRIGNRNLLCLMRLVYIAVAAVLAALFLLDQATPVSVFALGIARRAWCGPPTSPCATCWSARPCRRSC